MDARPIFSYNWLESPYLENPYPLYAQARRETPIFYSPIFNLWVITRYPAVRAALMDPKRFSSVFLMRTPSGAPAEVQAVLAEGSPEVPILVNEDPPGHTRTRNLVNKAFVPQRAHELEPRVREITDQLIDRFAGDGHADIVAQLAYPLPMAVLGELVGLPQDDLPQIKHWTEQLMVLTSPESSTEQQTAAAHSSVAFERYLLSKIEERQREPREDLLTALVHARLEAERPLQPAELVSLLINVIFAGHETTTNLIGNTLLLLLNHPETWRAIQAAPGLAADAIEESLRMEPPVQAMFRTTTEAIELSGVQVPAGASVLLSFAAANRDEEMFPEPDRFDLQRANKEQHLTFGRGIHFCVGAALARMEVRVVLEALARRLPNIRLEPQRPVTYLPSLLHRGPRQLHLVWD